jgi:hypothetical protein
MGIDARMFYLTKKKPTPNELLSLSHRLYEAFYGEPFFLYDEKHHILHEQTEFEQDGPNFEIPHGKSLIGVDLAGRFYGKEYERGNISEHVAVAEWIEFNVPDAEVFYGGDSSGVLAEPFDKIHRERILEHFYEVGHRPYCGGFTGFRNEPPAVCSRCHETMNDVGGGGDMTFFSCGGCDEKAITTKGKDRARWRGRKEFFEVSDELRKGTLPTAFRG